MTDYSHSTRLILKEAIKRKIKIINYDGRHFFGLKHKRKTVYFYNQCLSLTTSTAFKICLEKQITKLVLNKANINTAQGKYFKPTEFNEFLRYFKKSQKPVVVKPAHGTHGNLVFIGVSDTKNLKNAWNQIIEKYDGVILEKLFTGTEYRLFATRDKFLGAIERVPANVVGNGTNSIKELITIKNRDPKRGSEFYNKSLSKIKIDKTVKEFLKEQGLTLNFAPKKNKQIFLRKNSNISTGGDSIDCTDLMHHSWKKIAIRAINVIPGLAYGGIDLLTKDISKKCHKDNYIIIEVNASASLDIHHEPYHGKPRDIAKEIIDLAFPEDKKQGSI